MKFVSLFKNDEDNVRRLLQSSGDFDTNWLPASNNNLIRIRANGDTISVDVHAFTGFVEDIVQNYLETWGSYGIDSEEKFDRLVLKLLDKLDETDFQYDFYETVKTARDDEFERILDVADNTAHELYWDVEEQMDTLTDILIPMLKERNY